MTTLQRIVALTVGAIVTSALVALSRVPVPVHRSSDALLRVAMSARPERIERCRTVSDAELANTPAHMRQKSICEGAAAAYLLEVSRNGQLLSTDTVRGGGLRNDRQLYVLADFVVPSGSSDIEVRFSRIDSTASDSGARTRDDDRDDGARTRDRDAADRSDDDDRDRTARARRAADAVPHALLFRESVTLVPREIFLVTYDRDARRLRSARAR